MAPQAVAMQREASASADTVVEELYATLVRDGAVVLPPLVDAATLADMKAAFETQLHYLKSNDVDGFTRTELKRRNVENVLVLAQGFVDIGLHPIVTELARRYVGRDFSLCETKGWETLESESDFHGWHGDMWYDKGWANGTIPREVKLAFYLSDVDNGAFQYIKGTHQKAAPDLLTRQQAQQLPIQDMIEFKGPAGTAVMFDTSGIHRQGVPVLTRRRAVFYNYHDASVPLQQEDVDYYRYHPLTLNAAFLGDLDDERRRILGFGSKARYQPNFTRKPKTPSLNWAHERAIAAQLSLRSLRRRVAAKIKRSLGG